MRSCGCVFVCACEREREREMEFCLKSSRSRMQCCVCEFVSACVCVGEKHGILLEIFEITDAVLCVGVYSCTCVREKRIAISTISFCLKNDLDLKKSRLFQAKSRDFFKQTFSSKILLGKVESILLEKVEKCTSLSHTHTNTHPHTGLHPRSRLFQAKFHFSLTHAHRGEMHFSTISTFSSIFLEKEKFLGIRIHPKTLFEIWLNA